MVRAPAAGQESASFDDWVRPHLPVMFRVAARLVPDADLDDVVQNALARAWRKRRAYDDRRGTPAAWLCAIVADQARRSWRFRRHTAPVDELPDVAAPDGHVERDLDLERAVGRLPKRQRQAIDLHYFAGLSVAEVATVMRCSPGTVKSTLSDARARLRLLLGEEPS